MARSAWVEWYSETPSGAVVRGSTREKFRLASNSRRGVAASCLVASTASLSKRIANWGTDPGQQRLLGPVSRNLVLRVGLLMTFDPQLGSQGQSDRVKMLLREARPTVRGWGWRCSCWLCLELKSNKKSPIRDGVDAKEGREVRQGLRCSCRLQAACLRLGAIGPSPDVTLQRPHS
jgi:hypothetical protein